MQYDTELLRKLFSNLEIITGVSICLCDAGGVHITLTKASPCPLCMKVKKHYIGKCLETDAGVRYRFADDSGPYHYLCHFGLREAAIPVFRDGHLTGYLIAGPFRDPELYDQNCQDIRHYCDTYGFDRLQALEEYEKIPVFTEEGFGALAGLCQVLLEYASQKLIIRPEDYFDSVIRPYILHHLEEELTIPFLCRHFHMSQKLLYRRFRDSTGMTPGQWINRQRMDTARLLIASTDRSLPEIAAEVGVKDYNYFIKLFKKRFGYTPMHFRK